MILKSITLENYRPYIGPETIEFAEGEKNITIIQGQNDSGKTSLLNAFTWCFYGREYYRKQGQEPVYNKTSMKNTLLGETLLVKVLIQMKDNNNRDIRFIRSKEFIKNSDTNIKEGDENFDIYRYNENNEEEQILVTDNFMNSNLPEDLRKYFLFDGEQLIQFLDNKNKDNSIKNGVFTLSQLDLLTNLQSHISQRRNELHHQLKEINPELGNKKFELMETLDNQEKDNEELKDNKKNIERFENDIKRYETDIKEMGENPKQLQEKINSLEYNYKSIKNEIKENNNNLTKYLINNFNSIYSLPTFDNFLNISQYLEENKYIPSPFKKDFLKDLLKDKKCICGTEFTEDSQCYKELLTLFENTNEVTNLSDDVNMLRGRCEKSINDYPKDFKDILMDYYNENNNLDDELKLIDTELKAANIRLKRLNIDRINDLTKKIEIAKKNIKKLTETNGHLKYNLEEYYPNKIKELNEEIDEEEQQQKEIEIINQKLYFCNDVTKNIKEIKKSLSKEIHEQLESITSEEFKNIHWKDAYKRVLIDEDFNISFEKEDGSILTSTDPSSGTQLVVALSFMIALNSLSGFKLPLIIDTPLSRLDNDVRENIADYLPQYIKNKQMTFIVTNSEYTGNFKKKISRFVGKEYNLQYYNDDGEYTRVI